MAKRAMGWSYALVLNVSSGQALPCPWAAVVSSVTRVSGARLVPIVPDGHRIPWRDCKTQASGFHLGLTTSQFSQSAHGNLYFFLNLFKFVCIRS